VLLRRLSVILVVALYGAVPLSKVSADFDSLSSRVPSAANSIVLVDAEKIFESPAAMRQGWKEKLSVAHATGVTLLVPGASHAVFASHLDLEFMTPIWQAVILQMNPPVRVEDIARNTDGKYDRLGSLEAVRLPQDAYVVSFPDSVFGIMAPANRQAVKKWVQEVGELSQPGLSPYLLEAHRVADEIGTPIIMAIELEDAFSEAEVMARLKERWEEAGFQGKADPLAVGKVIASVRGMTLGVTFRDQPFGKIKIDFATDAKPLAAIAKPLFLHVLAHRGVSIDEFEDWKYEVSGHQVTLEGYFDGDGLQRIFSLFDRPPMLASPNGPSQAAPASQEPKLDMAHATLAYYQQVNELIKGLKRTKREADTYTMGSIATWCSSYAGKIDRLPILNVDPEMLDFGAAVSETLREAAMAIRTGSAQGSIAAMNTSAYDSYGYGDGYPAGYYGTYRYGAGAQGALRAESGARARTRRAGRSATSLNARQILDGLAPASQEIRRKMTEKYQIEF
jgi:hypothetical protein